MISGRSQSNRFLASLAFRSSSAHPVQDLFYFPGFQFDFSESRAEYALVAGGSKGIGYAIAEALARRGYNLILIARHMDSLISAKNKLEYDYHVHVEVLAYDLSFNDAATDIAKWCMDRNIPLKMLCNVAGFGGAKDYLSLPLDSLRYMINLNVGSAMALTLTLLPLLEKNAPSFILNVGSMAGFAPIPVKNLYSATNLPSSFLVIHSATS